MSVDEIKVTVCKYPDRENLVLRYVDPLTGKQKTRSAGTSDEETAIGKAAVWQDELTTGRYQAPNRLTWAEFRKRYEAEKLSSLAPRTQTTARDSLNCLERVINPDRLTKLTSAVMSRFQSELRKPREIIKSGEKIVKPAMKDTTVARHLRHVRAALSWAVSMGMLPKVPDMHSPRRAKGQTMMRGRPITAEEFDRLLLTVPKIRPHDAPAWIRYLTGLWLSGLRLEESHRLSWDEEAPFHADLTGRRPALRIYAEAQKSGRDEVLPMTPDFAELLLQTPEGERVGPVFNLLDQRHGRRLEPHRVGEIVVKIGKRAGVVVNKADGKYASAHDLRRAFGTRWAKRVMPAVLRRLMRHSSIQTTMAYYVDLDSAEVADELWAGWGTDAPAQGNNSGNTRPDAAKKPQEATAGESAEAPDNQHVAASLSQWTG
jgi:integrase